MYIEKENGWEQYSFEQLRKDNPNISFPTYPTDELLESFGVFKIKEDTYPEKGEFDTLLRVPPIMIDGVLTAQYKVETPSDEEIDKIQKKRLAFKAKSYLEETDWIVTKIAELQLEGVDIEPLKTKYANELAERKLMREVI